MKKTLSITIDIEDWYHIPSVCGSPFSVYKNTDQFFEKWNGRHDYLSEPTKRVLDLLDEYNVVATFFVVADVVENYPGLIESIVERGHEIACHGLHHACKIDPKSKRPLITKEEFELRTLKAKKILENISGKEVVGYRAPNGYVAGWMLDSLRKIGFKYDSSVSVNSFFNKTDSSLKNIFSHPYYPMINNIEPGKSKDLVEFPFSYYQMGGFKIPTSGGPMLRFLGAPLILKGLKQSLNRGHTVFYWHPIDISYVKFPKVGKGRPMYWAIKGKIVENRIRFILKNLNDSKIEFKVLSDVSISAKSKILLDFNNNQLKTDSADVVL
jgi:peptidoglycan-N-acetylglucosamine deacetylase